MTVRFRYDGEHISGVLDPFGNQVLWYERAGAELRGSPTDHANKVALDRTTHGRYTKWWRELVRDVTKCRRR